MTARALPAGTALGRGRAWKDGPVVDFVPVYRDGRSYNELTGEPQRRTPASQRARPAAEAFRTSDDYRLLFYVPGGGFQEFPPGAVKRISAGNALAWNLHYTPTGKPEKDRHRLGLWLARHAANARSGDQAHRRSAHHRGPGICRRAATARTSPPSPPFAGDWRITAITPFQEDVTLYGLWPHMHLRGKDMTFIATFPDGREEVLLHVPKYDFYWQLQYQLASPCIFRPGSTIKAIGHFDNSTRNKYNPRPDAPVYWSEQSWDEMFNGWMELSVDRHVITRQAVYSLATPMNSRVEPRRSAAGRRAASPCETRTAASSPRRRSVPRRRSSSPGRSRRARRSRPNGQEPSSGNVTVTMYDVPPDVSALSDDRRPGCGH